VVVPDTSLAVVDLMMKKFAKKTATNSCLNNLINAPESSTQSLFLYVIKLNFYFHRKEFRRKKGQINEEKPGIS
jgi:hypothetical protein